MARTRSGQDLHESLKRRAKKAGFVESDTKAEIPAPPNLAFERELKSSALSLFNLSLLLMTLATLSGNLI
jgi:hypothetical protein